MNPETAPRTFTEAPASFNCRAISANGFECQFTLRGNSGADLIPRAVELLRWLDGNGFEPTGFARKASPQNGDAQPASNGNAQPASNGAPVCPTHGTPMRESKRGGWYCPVKILDDDGSGKPAYCKAKVQQ